MSIENLIGTSDRSESLIKIRDLILQEIFSQCIICGLDPDLFSCEQYLDQYDSMDTHSYSHSFLKLYCEKYLTVIAKIQGE